MASSEPRGPRQILKALRYSIQGLRAAWTHEPSFRLEVWMFLPLAPLAFWLGESPVERALLFGCLILVLALELMNGAVEAIVDKTTPEIHELAGRAKDMGSAAVFLAQMTVLLTWGLILLPRWL
jgi:diacylglycerol kinase (ATP)